LEEVKLEPETWSLVATMSDVNTGTDVSVKKKDQNSVSSAENATTIVTISAKKKEEMRNESTGITVGDSSHTLADVSLNLFI
jgi:hypothetical protein